MELLLDRVVTERLFFRKLNPTDFEHWLPFHRDRRTSAFWYGLPKDPIDACRQDFDSTFDRYESGLGGKMALILRDTQEFIGLAGLLKQEVDQQPELEIAYSLLPRYWKNGFATEAAKKCKEIAFERNLAQSLISIIQVENIPSRNVALKLGMKMAKTTLYHQNQVHIYRIERPLFQN
jgi:RimJ/RimL family protein N-acetyltransferase